jgi:hypothetical protein
MMSKPFNLPQYIVVYRPHGRLMIETEFFGPFSAWIEAEDFADTLPALGYHDTDSIGNKGVKYVQELVSPEVKHGT